MKKIVSSLFTSYKNSLFDINLKHSNAKYSSTYISKKSEISEKSYNLSKAFKINSLLSISDEEKILKELLETYIFDKNYLKEELSVLQKISTKEFRKIQNSIKRKLIKEGKEEYKKAIEYLKDKSIEHILNGKAEDLPEFIVKDIIINFNELQKDILDISDEDLENILSKTIKKYSKFLFNQFKESTKVIKNIVSSESVKVITSSITDLGTEESKRRLSNLFDNLETLHKLDKVKKGTKEEAKLLEQLTPYNNNPLIQQTPFEIYSDLIDDKEYFLEMYNKIESFKDINTHLLKNKKFLKLITSASSQQWHKSLNIIKDAFIDLSSKVITDKILDNNGITTSTFYLFEKIKNRHISSEEQIFMYSNTVNSDNLIEQLSVGKIISLIEHKKDLLWLEENKKRENKKAYEKINGLINGLFKRNHYKDFIKKISGFEKSFENKVQKYIDMSYTIVNDIDIPTRVKKIIGSEYEELSEQAQTVYTNIITYREELNVIENNLEKSVKDSIELVNETINSSLTHIEELENYIEELKYSIDNFTDDVSSDNKITIEELEQALSLSIENSIKLKKYIEDLKKEELSLKLRYKDKIEEFRKFKSDIENLAEDIVSDTNATLEYIENKSSEYSNILSEIKEFDIKDLSKKIFSDTYSVLDIIKKDINTIKNAPVIIKNKFFSLIKYDTYKSIISNIKDYTKLSGIQKVNKFVSYLENVKQLSIDYGYKEDLIEYETELSKVAQLKMNFYSDIFPGHNQEETFQIFLKNLNLLIYQLLDIFKNKTFEEISEEVFSEALLILSNGSLKNKKGLFFIKELNTLNTLNTHSSEKILSRFDINESNVKIPPIDTRKLEEKINNLLDLKLDLHDKNIFKKLFNKFKKKIPFFQNKELFKEDPLKNEDFFDNFDSLLSELEAYGSGIYLNSGSFNFKELPSAFLLLLDTEFQKDNEDLLSKEEISLLSEYFIDFSNNIWDIKKNLEQLDILIISFKDNNHSAYEKLLPIQSKLNEKVILFDKKIEQIFDVVKKNLQHLYNLRLSLYQNKEFISENNQIYIEEISLLISKNISFLNSFYNISSLSNDNRNKELNFDVEEDFIYNEYFKSVNVDIPLSEDLKQEQKRLFSSIDKKDIFDFYIETHKNIGSHNIYDSESFKNLSLSSFIDFKNENNSMDLLNEDLQLISSSIYKSLFGIDYFKIKEDLSNSIEEFLSIENNVNLIKNMQKKYNIQDIFSEDFKTFDFKTFLYKTQFSGEEENKFKQFLSTLVAFNKFEDFSFSFKDLNGVEAKKVIKDKKDVLFNSVPFISGVETLSLEYNISYKNIENDNDISLYFKFTANNNKTDKQFQDEILSKDFFEDLPHLLSKNDTTTHHSFFNSFVVCLNTPGLDKTNLIDFFENTLQHSKEFIDRDLNLTLYKNENPELRKFLDKINVIINNKESNKNIGLKL